MGARCDLCPYAVDGRPRHQPVMDWGSPHAPYLAVFESPGPDEVTQGKCMVGWTGERTTQVLASFGLKREDFYIVNATKCQPPKGAAEIKLRKATDCCRPLLVQQMKACSARYVLAGGKAAFYALTGRWAINTTRGFVRDYDMASIIRLDDSFQRKHPVA